MPNQTPIWSLRAALVSFVLIYALFTVLQFFATKSPDVTLRDQRLNPVGPDRDFPPKPAPAPQPAPPPPVDRIRLEREITTSVSVPDPKGGASTTHLEKTTVSVLIGRESPIQELLRSGDADAAIAEIAVIEDVIERMTVVESVFSAASASDAVLQKKFDTCITDLKNALDADLKKGTANAMKEEPLFLANDDSVAAVRKQVLKWAQQSSQANKLATESFRMAVLCQSWDDSSKKQFLKISAQYFEAAARMRVKSATLSHTLYEFQHTLELSRARPSLLSRLGTFATSAVPSNSIGFLLLSGFFPLVFDHLKKLWGGLVGEKASQPPEQRLHVRIELPRADEDTEAKK